MNRCCLMIVSATLLVFSSAIVIAQEPLKTVPGEQGNPCSQFKLRVVAPNDGVDYKLITTRPDGAVEYKGKVITACRPEGFGIAQESPSPLITPGLKHSFDARERLRLRLEMLKQSQPPSGKK